MSRRRGFALAIHVLLASALLAAWAALPALAAGPGLPRTYQVQRVDSPEPGLSKLFAFGLVNGGDLNGDGEDDMLVAQGTGILNDGGSADQGEVFVISGADGSTITKIPAPEPDTDAAGNDRRSAFGYYLGRIGRNATNPADFTDLGSCPGGDGADADAICDALTVGAADGIPDIVASAIHVDRASPAAADGTAEDIGRVYVIDGATFAVLKRIDMPQADVDDMADETEQLVPGGTATPVRPWYGRTVLNPAGQPPCEGNYGVGACPPASAGVKKGDLDGGGSPDVVVGASAYKYEEAEGTNPACNDTAAVDDVCIRSGRFYMYRGEDIVGSSPTATLETAQWNIRNPYAQADVQDTSGPTQRVINQLELLGHSVSPVGDNGTCTAAVAPGDECPPASVSGAPDGKPEVVVSAFRVDYPISGPDNDRDFDIGVNALIDGATGSILQTYKHPDEDPGSIFGFTIYNQPAVGDMGSTALPDVYLPAAGQDTDTHRGEGIGFVMNGSPVVSGNTIDIQRFRDPTPNTSGSFGTTAAGVGDIQGEVHNEILIGEFPTHNPPQNDQVISDVHFFDPITGQALQTIADPDQQQVSSFGLGAQPLGDLNGDGFLDFGVGAGRYDGSSTDQGRLYIFRSDNSPAPSAAPPPSSDGGGPAPTPAVVLAGRSIELVASVDGVPRGRSVTLTGTLEAFANEASCVPGQEVAIQQRLPRRSGYTTIERLRTDSEGNFSLSVRPTRTTVYRAVVSQTEQCLGTASEGDRVGVLQRVAISRRTVTLTRSGFARVRLRCPSTQDGGCTGVLNLKTARRVSTGLPGRPRIFKFGEEAFRIPAGRTAVVKIQLSANNRALMRRLGRTRVRAVAVNEDRSGLRATSVRTIVLRAPGRR